MAYVIKITNESLHTFTASIRFGIDSEMWTQVERATNMLVERLRERLSTFVTYEWSKRTTKQYVAFELRNVRLKEPKPYCGNHAGPCVVRFVDKPKRRAKFLEGADWMQVHALVNAVLDEHKVTCDVFTDGADVWNEPGIAKGRLLVRTAMLGARKRYDYHDGSNGRGPFPHYLWNPGTPDQFRDGTGHESEEI